MHVCRSRIHACLAAAALAAAVVLGSAAAAVAQRFLPGPLEAIPDARIEVRRPLGFKPDPTAPDDVHTIERLRGSHGFRGIYRSWFLTLRRHVGFSDVDALRKAWKAYLGGEKPGWSLTFHEPRTYGDLTGLLVHAVPGDANKKGLTVSAAVMLGGGRLLEVRIDVMKEVHPALGLAFVDDFIRNAVLDPEALGPERLLVDDLAGLQLPRRWILSQGEGDLRFTARHPDGATRAALSWRRLAEAPTDPAAALRTAIGDTPLAREQRSVDHVQPGSAWLAVTTDGRVLAVARQGEAAFRVEATGRDPAELEQIVVRTLLSLRVIDPGVLAKQVSEQAKALRAAMKQRRKGEDDAIAALEALVGLMDLPAARTAAKKALAGGTPRVVETAARAHGARADNFTTPALARSVRKTIRRDLPVTLAAIYRGLGRAARPAALPLLEAGLRQTHPVTVVAAAEALRAPMGKPQKAFDTLTGFWERLETWAAERPQMKDEIAYDALVRIIRTDLQAISGQQFARPAAARTWFGANRRHVRPR